MHNAQLFVTSSWTQPKTFSVSAKIFGFDAVFIQEQKYESTGKKRVEIGVKRTPFFVELRKDK